jgi:hypothetical protein
MERWIMTSLSLPTFHSGFGSSHCPGLDAVSSVRIKVMSEQGFKNSGPENLWWAFFNSTRWTIAPAIL